MSGCDRSPSHGISVSAHYRRAARPHRNRRAHRKHSDGSRHHLRSYERADGHRPFDRCRHAWRRSVLTQKGPAPRINPNKNGRDTSSISTLPPCSVPTRTTSGLTRSVEEAVRIGADAVSIHLNSGVSTSRASSNSSPVWPTRPRVWGMPVLATTCAVGSIVHDDYDAEAALAAATL